MANRKLKSKYTPITCIYLHAIRLSDQVRQSNARIPGTRSGLSKDYFSSIKSKKPRPCERNGPPYLPIAS